MSGAKSGFGTLLKMGDGADPEVFTTIAEVKDIGGPSYETGTHDVTNQSSPGAVREFISGLIDAGEVTFDVNWMPGNATHDDATGLLAAQLDRELKSFRLVWPQFTPNEQCAFEALVTGFETNSPVDDPLSASVTLKVSGLPVWTTLP